MREYMVILLSIYEEQIPEVMLCILNTLYNNSNWMGMTTDMIKQMTLS
jgi:hypothetical protein